MMKMILQNFWRNSCSLTDAGEALRHLQFSTRLREIRLVIKNSACDCPSQLLYFHFYRTSRICLGLSLFSLSLFFLIQIAQLPNFYFSLLTPQSHTYAHKRREEWSAERERENQNYDHDFTLFFERSTKELWRQTPIHFGVGKGMTIRNHACTTNQRDMIEIHEIITASNFLSHDLELMILRIISIEGGI